MYTHTHIHTLTHTHTHTHLLRSIPSSRRYSTLGRQVTVLHM